MTRQIFEVFLINHIECISLLIYLPYLRPTEEERAVYNEAEEFLAESATILAKLRDYRGATKEIR